MKFFRKFDLGFGFKKSWAKEVNIYQNKQNRDPVLGPWKGVWETDTNGHTGKLECIISRNESEGSYHFRYFATWAFLLRGTYEVTFPVTEINGEFVIEGDENLGFFGNYHHSGKISGDEFTASYSNGKNEVGNFRMIRPVS
ncbi:MAG: hypothetical protein P1U89_00765 [Verrucomicrobiales bacterium]|nr:hypothetical protein [Verrucomicrobiales bacterium]